MNPSKITDIRSQPVIGLMPAALSVETIRTSTSKREAEKVDFSELNQRLMELSIVQGVRFSELKAALESLEQQQSSQTFTILTALGQLQEQMQDLNQAVLSRLDRIEHRSILLRIHLVWRKFVSVFKHE